MPKKLTSLQVSARLSMYDEAINALFAYESDEFEEVKEAENSQKQIVIRQINALADKFLVQHKKPE